jgi:hypothetical protein
MEPVGIPSNGQYTFLDATEFEEKQISLTVHSERNRLQYILSSATVHPSQRISAEFSMNIVGQNASHASDLRFFAEYYPSSVIRRSLSIPVLNKSHSILWQSDHDGGRRVSSNPAFNSSNLLVKPKAFLDKQTAVTRHLSFVRSKLIPAEAERGREPLSSLGMNIRLDPNSAM